MKTKEEIEKLAYDAAIKEYKGDDGTIGTGWDDYKYGFRDCYIQCQVDMQKDVEYWQGEFEHWYRQAMDMSNKYNELLNKQD